MEIKAAERSSMRYGETSPNRCASANRQIPLADRHGEPRCAAAFGVVLAGAHLSNSHPANRHAATVAANPQPLAHRAPKIAYASEA